jgi:hypothetical protein
MFPTGEAGVVTEGVPFTPCGAGDSVIHPGKNTIAVRKTEQRSIP